LNEDNRTHEEWAEALFEKWHAEERFVYIDGECKRDLVDLLDAAAARAVARLMQAD